MTKRSMVALIGLGILELYFRKLKQIKIIEISAANAAAISAVGLSAPIDKGTSSIRHETVLAKKASALFNQDDDFLLIMVGSNLIKKEIPASSEATILTDFDRYALTITLDNAKM